MVLKEPVPDFLLVIISLIVALLFAAVMQSIAGRWDAVLFVIVLFFLLWTIASKRGWSIPGALPFIRSSVMSEVLLGLLITILVLAVSWFIGSAISRAVSDIAGILAGLVIFGVIMLVVSASRDWQ